MSEKAYFLIKCCCTAATLTLNHLSKSDFKFRLFNNWALMDSQKMTKQGGREDGKAQEANDGVGDGDGFCGNGNVCARAS